MVALVFLVLGFQLAIFVVKVVERPNASEAAGVFRSREHFFCERDEKQSREVSEPEAGAAERAENVPRKPDEPSRSKLGGYERPAKNYGGGRKPTSAEKPRRTVESFAFDPNTVSLEDLQRLGLSERQAQSIENYRTKGGRFRSKADFQKMYVVSDTLYARLEPYIEIPKLELNAADSAALVSLRGIGPWYARKILDYRERLGGFVSKQQLLEIDGIDAERFAGLADDVTVDSKKIRRLDLWHASDSVLARHPYLGAKGARSVVRYRELYDSARWTLPDLSRERVLPEENIEKLKKYIESQ